MKKWNGLSFLILFTIIAFLLVQIAACKKSGENEISILTKNATNISFRHATLNGLFNNDNNLNDIREYGFEIENPAFEKISIGSIPDSTLFSHEIAGLDHDSEYAFRAYAKDKDGNFYFGENLSFKTIFNPDAGVPIPKISAITKITSSTAVLKGTIENDGGSSVSVAGFCIDTLYNPSVELSECSGNIPQDSTFEHKFKDLIPETTYYIVAYAENKQGIGYSAVDSFVTSPYAEPYADWVHYDNGENYTGMALTQGTSFDVAMRFIPEQLEPFEGMYITRIKFFPKAPIGTKYTLQILTGVLPGKEDIEYEQYVEFHILGRWNDIELNEPYRIGAKEELWVGYHVEDQAYNTFPAGVDNGPGYPGYSDLFSLDGMHSWTQMSTFGHYFNWNLQVFVTNELGKEIPLLVLPPASNEKNIDTRDNKTINLKPKMMNP